jgi:tetratricopeptide (TPR) repeat protein/predicted Ser/Thr protein kinase
VGCIDADTVMLYLARQLAEGPRDDVEQHLDACADCRRVVAALVKDAVPDADDEAQIELGRYRVDGELGRGSMGIVFAAHDPELQRDVAIKLLRPGSAADDATRRLRREAEAMAAVSHPNVVSVFDVGTTDDGDVFFAMERIEGSTLRKWLAERSRGETEIVAAFAQAGRGLEAAHRAGLVHRDFKPDNVLVEADSGRVVVTDFGLARIERSSATPVPNTSDVVTVTGALVGTPAYMAPEQLDGARGDARSDQFSFCVALFEALHGRRPFVGHTVEALKELIARGDIPDRGGSPWIRRALHRGLQRDPDARFPDMSRLLAALARPRRRWPAIVGGVTLAAVTGWLVWSTLAGNACADERSGWSSARAEAIRSALMGRSAYDTAAAERTIAALERFDETWTTTLTTTCEAHVAPDDARLRCLDDARRRFAAVLEVVAEPDTVNGEGAITASTRLPDPEDCLDARRESSHEVDIEAADALAHAEALGHAGRTEEAIALAREAADRAASVGDVTTRARALVVSGHLRQLSGDAATAEQELETAYALASEHDDDRNVTEAALEMAFVVGVVHNEVERGSTWARYAASALARMETSPILEARLHHVLGHIRSVGGDEAAAFPEFQAAVAALDAAGEQDDARYGSYLCSLAESLHKLGRFDEARPQFQAALERLEEHVGEGHIMLTSCQLDYGGALEIDQDLDEAEVVLERALRGALSSRPRDDPGIARYLEGMAGLRLNQRRSAEAADLYREVLEIDQRAKGPSHPAVATSWSNLATALDEVGRHDEARAAVERALLITREALGDENPRVGRLLMLLGIFARRAGDLDTARTRLEEAVAALAIAPGRDHPLYEVAREELGVVLIQSDPAAALALLREVLTNLDASMGVGHANSAHTHARISEALLALGRRDEALEHLIVARDILTPVLGPTHPNVLEMHARVDELERRARASSRAGTHRGQPLDPHDTQTASRPRE